MNINKINYYATLAIILIICIITFPIGIVYVSALECFQEIRDKHDGISDEEFMDKKIFTKYQYLTNKQRLKFLHAVEKMLDEQYNKKK